MNSNMTALLVYPYVAHWLFAGNTEQVGSFLGTAIHDTSQVAGAGLASRPPNPFRLPA